MNLKKRSGSKTPQSRAALTSESQPLLGLLVAAAVIEIIAHRLMVTALAPPPFGKVTGTYRLLATLAPFFYYLAGLTTVPVIVWSSYHVLRYASRPKNFAKFALGLASCFFLPLGAVSMAASMQPAPGVPPNSAAPLLPYLNLAFLAYLSALFVMAWSRPSDLKQSLSVTALLIPIISLALYRHLVWNTTPTQQGALDRARNASLLVEYGTILVELAGLWLFFLLAPGRQEQTQDREDIRKWLRARAKAALALASDPISVSAGLIVTVVLAVGAKFRYRLVEHLANRALGISVPTTPGMSVAVLFSSVLFFSLLMGLVRSNRRDRATAAGLTLVALSGFRLDDAMLYMISAAGFHVLVFPEPPVALQPRAYVTARQWKAWLESIRGALTDIGLHDIRIGAADMRSGSAASIFGRFEESNLEIRFESGRDGHTATEVFVGEIPTSRPDLVLLVRRSMDSRNSPKIRLQAISDPDGLGQTILADSKQLKTSGLQPGRVSLWWGLGLRYQVDVPKGSMPGSPPEIPFSSLVEGTILLARKASILSETDQAPSTEG